MPLTIPDQSIAAQGQQINPMNTLGSMLNIANSAQNLKKEQATFNSDVNQRAAESSSAQSSAQVKQANVDPLIQQQLANTSSAKTGAESAKFGLAKNYGELAQRSLSALVNDPRITAGTQLNPNSEYDPEEATKAILEQKKNMVNAGLPETQAEVAAAPLLMQIHTPGAIQGMALNLMKGQMSAPQQASAIQPNGPSFDDSQNTGQINTNQLAGNQGVIPSTVVEKQLPVNTTVMGGPNGTTPGYLGQQHQPVLQPLVANQGFPANVKVPAPTPGNQINPGQSDQLSLLQQELRNPSNSPADNAAIQREIARLGSSQNSPSGFIASGLPAGKADAISGQVANMTNDWNDTLAQSKNASQDIGILQNIKQYAPGSATGVTGAREAYIAGLAAKLGMTPEEVLKTNTDILAKNANMLALAGGNTDAARAMAEAANPHSSMTVDAMIHSADQIIAQKQAALNKASLLQPYRAANDENAYGAVLNHWNNINDPKVLQYPNMSKDEQAALKKSMTPDQQVKFKNALASQQSLGFIK